MLKPVHSKVVVNNHYTYKTTHWKSIQNDESAIPSRRSVDLYAPNFRLPSTSNTRLTCPKFRILLVRPASPLLLDSHLPDRSTSVADQDLPPAGLEAFETSKQIFSETIKR